jgi:hypothetical protein
MMKLSTKIFLMCVALMFSASGAFALPNCKGSYSSVTWTNCFGAYTWADGNNYVGEFRDGKLTGRGTYTLPNGEKYVGEFRDGKRTGQGTYSWVNGEKYVGEFRDGKRTGLGTFSWPNGEKYVGQFRDGKLTGEGTYTWANGNKYVGELNASKLNGQGTYTWANGEKYVGEFREDERSGKGTFSWPNGQISKGIWENNLYQYTPKISSFTNSSLLHVAFKQLSKESRKQVQSTLYSLGFYESSIDGLYGKRTAAALRAYNKQNFNEADLENNQNIEKLFNSILELKS